MNFIDFPIELQLYIFSFLDIKSLLMVAAVCKKTKQISLAPVLWKPFEAASREDYIRIYRKVKIGLQEMEPLQKAAADLVCDKINDGLVIQIHLIGDPALSVDIYRRPATNLPSGTLFHPNRLGASTEKTLQLDKCKLRINNSGSAKISGLALHNMNKANIAIICASGLEKCNEYLTMIKEKFPRTCFLFAIKEKDFDSLKLSALNKIAIKADDSLSTFFERVIQRIQAIAPANQHKPL